ncbi:MAG TPA: chemotaxis protein CheA [Candidatus Lokiarchaeia archaeon]|nr:chemotaxis protein CheA [Candidatus Lokiarchaeia archaeon]
MATKEDISLFINETDDYVQRIEDATIRLEKNPSDKKPFEDMFFAFHSLKGLTSMMGLGNMSKLCHNLESFMQKGKENGIDERKAEFVGLLFDSLDILRSMLQRYKNNDISDLDEAILNEIKDRSGSFDSSAKVTLFNSAPIETLNAKAADEVNHFYSVHVKLQETCMFKKVRLFIIFRALNDLGLVCFSNPEPDRLENGQFEFEFELYVIATQEIDDLEKVLDEILEIEEININIISATDLIQLISDYNAKSEKNKTNGAGDHKINGSGDENENHQGDEAPDRKKEARNESSDASISAVKVGLETLDTLMNNFSELVVIRNKLSQSLEKRQIVETNRLLGSMDKLFLEIQAIMFKLKLVKVESTFNKFKRLVRDLAKEQNKEIDFTMDGLNVEIDRKILEDLSTPIIHLLRNSIDHGIESAEERIAAKKNPVAKVKLKTYRLEGSIFIEVEDDGKGIDFNKIRQKLIEKYNYSPKKVSELDEDALLKVILLPGFSTKDETTMVSGRGMGLAIVDKAIHQLSGTLDIKTTPGEGTRFILKVPFTRAILKTQIVTARGDLFGIPIEHITQIYSFKPENVQNFDGNDYYCVENQYFPIINFGKILNDDDTFKASKVAVLCKQDDANQTVIIFDDLKQQMDIVIKPFISSHSNFSEILGSTITGDGSICIILDIMSLISSRVHELKPIQASIMNVQKVAGVHGI